MLNSYALIRYLIRMISHKSISSIVVKSFSSHSTMMHGMLIHCIGKLMNWRNIKENSNSMHIRTLNSKVNYDRQHFSGARYFYNGCFKDDDDDVVVVDDGDDDDSDDGGDDDDDHHQHGDGGNGDDEGDDDDDDDDDDGDDDDDVISITVIITYST